jgi:hypothetical protein
MLEIESRRSKDCRSTFNSQFDLSEDTALDLIAKIHARPLGDMGLGHAKGKKRSRAGTSSCSPCSIPTLSALFHFSVGFLTLLVFLFTLPRSGSRR